MARPNTAPTSPAPAGHEHPGAAAIERIIDGNRAKEGLSTAASERQQFEQDVRRINAQPGSKVSIVAGAPKRILTPERFEQAQAKRRLWVVDVEHGTAIEDLLDHRFWTNVASQLAHWDRIEVRCEDGSYWAELIVEDQGARYAKVRVLQFHELQVADPEGPSLPPGYELLYKGPHSRWTVLRDGLTLRDKFTSKGVAQAWLTDHLRVVSR